MSPEENRGSFLVQLLLPLLDNEGQPFGRELFDRILQELMDKFGGVTAYVRSPAEGLWTKETGHAKRDQVIILETMVDALDPEWWRSYRRKLERQFAQESIVIRAQRFRRL